MRLGKKDFFNKNDLSRFDIYTPGRIFNLKSENENEINSTNWVEIL
jgi:hypothetical protein